MPKVLEGFVDDGRAAPLPGISAIVTVVGDGAVVASGITGPDGHWQFDDLPDDQEYFVNIVDTEGNAIVRGPWSGEVRDVWVRDRLAVPATGLVELPNGGNTVVGGLPLVISDDPTNTLEWRPDGIYTASGGLTQVAADLRYEPIDTAYTKAEADALFSPIDAVVDAWTKAESDARYEPFDTAYTKAEADARYAELTDLDPFPQYLTPAEADTLFLTQAEGDARYTQGGITQTAADLRYEPLDSAYTKTEDDARFVNLAGGSVMTGLLGPTTTNTRDLGTTGLRWRALYGMTADLTTSLTVASKPLVISPDAANIVEWRANGLYAAAGAVSDVWVNTTGDTMTGDLNMTANVLPTVTNVRDLGSTALRWRKLWAVDGEFTNAPTVGGAALLTQTAADAVFLTPAEGNAAYATTAHAHDAAYVNVSGDTMTGDLLVQRDSSGTTMLAILQASTGLGARMDLMKSRGTIASPSATIASDDVGSFQFVGRGNSATAVAAAIAVTVDAANAAGNIMQGRLAILTANATGVSTERLRVDKNGVVTVGPLTDPALPAGYTAAPGLLVQQEGAHVNGLSLARASSADAAAETLNVWRARGTWASKVAIANGDVILDIASWAWSGANWLRSAVIQTVVSGTVTTTATPTAMNVLTADSAGTLAARVSIGPTGLVGVGAMVSGAATAQLDVKSTAAAVRPFAVRGHASGAYADLMIQMYSTDGVLRWGVRSDGGYVTENSAATASVSALANAFPVFNVAGTLLGWCPLYTTRT